MPPITFGYAMNLHHLEVFHAVAETGSVSLGAERLMVSQPAVSKQIKGLERQLDVRLFDRHPKGVRLTDAGRLLQGYARRIFALTQEARAALDDLSSLRSGSLAIGAGPTVGIYLLPRVMVHFRQRFPGIRLRIETAGPEVLREQLSDGLLDLVLTESVIDDPALESTAFASDVLVPVASSAHPFAKSQVVSPKAFCAEPFIARETSSPGGSLVERTLASRGFRIEPYLTLASTEAIKQAVTAGLGVTMLSRLAVVSEITSGQLKQLRIKSLSIRYPLHQVRLRNHVESRPAKAFLCLLRHPLRGQAGRLLTKIPLGSRATSPRSS
jgi:DNA-binding transcriptional LysR family regulator